jgi:nucleotide-binding universal stress UspA family protein
MRSAVKTGEQLIGYLHEPGAWSRRLGDPSEAILETGRRLKAGVIVMGTHGLGGIRKLLVVIGLANTEESERRRPGSIAYRVLRVAHVAVIVVPALRQAAPDQPTSQHALSMARASCGE